MRIRPSTEGGGRIATHTKRKEQERDLDDRLVTLRDPCCGCKKGMSGIGAAYRSDQLSLYDVDQRQLGPSSRRHKGEVEEQETYSRGNEVQADIVEMSCVAEYWAFHRGRVVG